jgi:hypothetical protein
VTIFYTLFIYIWSERFYRNIGLFQWLLWAVGILRLFLMLFPHNE